MTRKLDKKNIKKDIEEIAEMAEKGQDVSSYFTGSHTAKQRVNIDFPLQLLKQIDDECKRIGVTRQAWVKMICDERIRQTNRSSAAA